MYMSADYRPTTVANTAPSKCMRANEIENETAKTVKVNRVLAVMSIYCRKKCNWWNANPGNEEPSCYKAECAKIWEENSHKSEDHIHKRRKGSILKK